MKLFDIIDSKLQGSGIDLKKELGESFAGLENVELADEVASKFTAALLNLAEAEASPTIIGKVRDSEHKAAKKAVMDSIDSLLEDHIETLGETQYDNTKDKAKAILGKYKSENEVLKADNLILAQKAKDGLNDAETKALMAEKEAKIKDLEATRVKKTDLDEVKVELEHIKKTHVPKEEVEKFKAQLKLSESKVKRLDLETFNQQIINKAMRDNMLSESVLSMPSKTAESLILAAVNTYLEEKKLGIEGVSAKLILDEDTRKIIVRQVKDETSGVAVDGKTIGLDDVIREALQYSNIHNKGGVHEYRQKSTVTATGVSAVKDKSNKVLIDSMLGDDFS